MTQASQAPETAGSQRLSWRAALRVYGERRILAMALLGFAAGLPFLLVGGTLSYWMRESGVDLKTIGFASWIGLAYSYKVVWSPLVDRLPIPLLTRRLGRRRAIMLPALLIGGAGLAAMAKVDPAADLTLIVVIATIVAVASATFDIALDAYRIEQLPPTLQGAGVGAYSVGYRGALLAAGAGALYLADFAGWAAAYLAMAGLAGIGVITVLCVSEAKIEGNTAIITGRPGVHTVGARVRTWLTSAVIDPLVDFVRRNGVFTALLVLAFIGSFRLADLTLGAMANPFYVDIGYSKSDVASISKVFGVVMTLAGSLLGGMLVARFGTRWPLICAAAATAGTNLLFAWIATLGPERWALAMAISADNLAGGVAGTAFIAYLSGQTSAAYTATQYALFSSLMSLPGTLLRGYSGYAAEALGWEGFFIATAALGLPGLVLAILVTATRNDVYEAKATFGSSERGSSSQ